ncbi:hypothetical protein F4803DRAFT_556194 [Xylaria telfairii]|nr:hypothetical protein F4803DRAFT_556194 [Xylaria telfairii]
MARRFPRMRILQPNPDPTRGIGGDRDRDGTPTPAFSTHKRSQIISNEVSDCSIYGEVMGNSIEAFPDSGADGCFISPETSMLFGLDPQPGIERLVRLADGRELVSPGVVDVPWSFLGEDETFNITCWILPGCRHQMILGNGFLKETRGLTTLRHRIHRKHISAHKYVHVNLIGEGKQRLRGYLNGVPVAALPDTGSDVMIMSWDYAWRAGLKVYSNPEDIVEVEFADGTTALTDGIVRDVVWSSGDHSIRCDFLVLDNLSVDVILAKDYLFDMDVFSNCSAHLTEDEDTENLDVYGIRLVREFGERFGETLDQLEDDSIEDVISQDAFSPAMINREWARRDRIRDEIEALDANKRAEAKAAEARRQEQWEKARAEHRRRWTQAQTPSHPRISTIERLGSSQPTSQRDPEGGTALGQLAPPGNAMRHFRWLKRPRVSIPLLPLRRNGSSHTSEHQH